MVGVDDEGSDDDLLFTEDEEQDPAAEASQPPRGEPWTILIVDDDPEVHAITRVVLGDVVYADRPLRFLSAYSGTEARDVLRQHTDIATILLDVVMETDDAGLRLVRFIRDELQNQQVRIILRTGQPGQAPERQVIVSYDINDYKAKSELTAQKLFTATVAALRSYQHISTIEQSRRGLEKIIEASATLFEQRSLEQFVQGVILQISSLIRNAQGSLLCTVKREAKNGGAVDCAEVVAGSGPFEEHRGRPVRSCISPEVAEDIETAFRERCNIYRDNHLVMVFRSRNHAASVVYIRGPSALNDIDRRLIEIFCAKVAIGFDNVYLYEQLINAQKATVYALGKMAEFKDEVTGEHVKRIERMATRIAQELSRRGHYTDQIDDAFIEHIGMASILHDVGKVGIPDRILRKPGKLDPDEMKVMREHAAMGGTILREAAGLVDGNNYLSMGAEIAESHHEKFNGAGYPHGIKGMDIPLAGRIVAVADVFDALMHKRPYKDAWTRDSALELIRKETGEHFDPLVVEAFLTVVQEEYGNLPAPEQPPAA
ncbi:MAG TPA: DUF3369 domain-containing protein [Azospirillaceae bacterium]|nr:DUF3369 domain-containing protein [Azospirillaceae bacterium]